MEGRFEDRIALQGQSTQRREVVDDVDSPTKRTQHQIPIPFLNHHIADRNRGDVVGPVPPIHPVVEAHVKACLGAEEEQVGCHRILHDGQHMARRFRSQANPGLASIGRVVQHRRPVVAPVIVHHHEHFIGVVSGNVNEGNPRPRREPLDVHGVIRPRFATVGRVLEPPIVRAHPNLALPMRARGDREDRAVVLGLRSVDGQAARECLLELGRVVGGQVWAERFPAVPPVGRMVKELAAEVQAVL